MIVLNSALIPMDLTHVIAILGIELLLMGALAMVSNYIEYNNCHAC